METKRSRLSLKGMIQVCRGKGDNVTEPRDIYEAGLDTVKDEVEKEIKNDLCVSLKGKEKIASEGERHKSERHLLKKEWIILSRPQKNFFFSLKSLKQIPNKHFKFNYKDEKKYITLKCLLQFYWFLKEHN